MEAVMIDRSDQTLTPRLRQDLFERLAARKNELFWTGLGMTLVGFLALLFPAIASLSVEIMVGWLLILAGAVTIYGAFSYHGYGPFFGSLLLGLLKVALGVFLLMHPALGVLALTLLLAAIFMVDGAVQTVMAFDLKPREGWGWVLASALISIAVGLLIAAGWPNTSLFAIGLLVGINFLSTGVALLALSHRLKPAT
jgi:uncharacterized membrane protein HdeD (DUF308 family)